VAVITVEKGKRMNTMIMVDLSQIDWDVSMALMENLSRQLNYALADLARKTKTCEALQDKIDQLNNELVEVKAEKVKPSVHFTPETVATLVDDLEELGVVPKHKIRAIKILRLLTGCGLKEAKDALDKHWPPSPKSF
jgi:ribosomal protein L7/L12